MIRSSRKRAVARVLVGLGLISMVATGCDYKPSDEVALKVNGHVTTMGEFNDFMAGLAKGHKCIEGLGFSPQVSFDDTSYNGVATRFAANVIVQSDVLQGLLDQQKLTVTDAEAKAAVDQMTKICPNGQDKELSSASLTRLTNLLAHSAVSKTAAPTAVADAAASAVVYVSPRLGVWNAATASVEAGSGPVKVKPKPKAAATTSAP